MSPSMASPGAAGAAPVTQFTFRKGVHLPAIKSPPKMPLIDPSNPASSPSQAGGSASVVASPSPAEFARLGSGAGAGADTPVSMRPTKGAPSAAASPAGLELADLRNAGNDDDAEESQHYKLSKPYVARPFVEAPAKTAQGPNAQGAEFVTPSVASNEWADWHLKQSGGKAAPKESPEKEKGTKVLVATRPGGLGSGAPAEDGGEKDPPVRNQSVSAGDAILDVGGLDSERDAASAAPAKDNTEAATVAAGANGMTLSQKKRSTVAADLSDREAAELALEKQRTHRYAIVGGLIVLVILIILFGYLWGGNPEDYVSESTARTIAVTTSESSLQKLIVDNSTLSRGSVLGDHVAYRTLTEYNLATAAATTRVLANGSVTAEKIASGALEAGVAAALLNTHLIGGGTSAGDLDIKTGASGKMSLITGMGGLTIDTLHSGGLISTLNPGPVSIASNTLTATVNEQATISAKGVALAASTGDASVKSTSGKASVEGASASLASTSGKVSVSAATDLSLQAPLGAMNLSASSVNLASSSSMSLESSSSMSLEASSAMSLAASSITLSAPEGDLLLQGKNIVLEGAVQTSVTVLGAMDLVTVTTTAATNATNATSTTTVGYEIDFAALPSTLLQFSGVVPGAVTLTVKNCDAAHAGIEVTLLNTLTSSLARTAPLLQLSQATCSGVFASSIPSGASSSISCVGPLPNAPSGDHTRVLCQRVLGGASSLSAVAANGTIGLSDGVGNSPVPGSVSLNATAGLINLHLTTSNDLGNNWGTNVGSNGYLRASFWLINSEVTSAHSGVQFTLVASGSTPSQTCVLNNPCSGKNKPGSEGVFLITKQELVPGVGALVTVTLAAGQVFPGEVISYIFTLV